MTNSEASSSTLIDDRIDERTADLLFREAHTTYSFTDRPVSDEQLAEVYDLMRFAPTAMNSQPLRITFVRSPEAKSRLLPHLSVGNRPKSESAPVVAILAADIDFHENLPRLLPQSPRAKEGFSDIEARITSARMNAAIQAGYFILTVRAVGLDAGPMGGVDTVGLDREFFEGTSLRSFMVVNIGHAAAGGQFPRNPRLEHHEAVTTL